MSGAFPRAGSQDRGASRARGPGVWLPGPARQDVSLGHYAYFKPFDSDFPSGPRRTIWDSTETPGGMEDANQRSITLQTKKKNPLWDPNSLGKKLEIWAAPGS